MKTIVTLIVALVVMAGAAAAQANHGWKMPFDTFQPRGWDKYNDTNSILRSKCRSPFRSMEDFAGKSLRDVLPVWRHVKLDRLNAKRARAKNKASRCIPWYITKQINIAWKIANESNADPWPNCPDPGPRDNQGPGHSWYDTVACENNGSWLDSPGYYRCGLQFDPGWEIVYGRLCP